MPPQRPLLKRATYLVTVLFLLLAVSWTHSKPANAYSLEDLREKATEVEFSITETASNARKSAAQTASSTSAAISSRALHSGEIALNGAKQVGTNVSSTAFKVGKTATHQAFETSSALGDTALSVGKSLTVTTIDVSGVVGTQAVNIGKTAISTAGEISVAAARETATLVEQAAIGTKAASEAVAAQITDAFKNYTQPLLETAISQVDLNQVEATVKQIQQEVLEPTPEALTQRFIRRKVIEASETGSWLETARLQAELIYQIAAIYGLELSDTIRKQEILNIAATNLGSSQMLKTSLPLIRYAIGQVPLAGDALGMAVDWGGDRLIRSLMFPLLGQAACKYYAVLQPASTLEAASVPQSDAHALSNI
ncbi:hypothetical protein IQ268_13660 [Oculatella sp. LEGE 06141]|uniref:hypothetical protein n=1 Tax=Oculatella sp. LEGE 06141 TaxID=1828648 RepID=UPI00187E4F61|nr:hypothetical protein [Oculatella sp. LEGE 06141]MBE9179610.1 hypothetical protein [Oculatella sp. LEGE 06141]